MARPCGLTNHDGMSEPALNPAESPASPPARKFVRVLERHANGLVRFEFAVGWPDLSCELVLPHALFDDFCRAQRVEFLDDEAQEGPEA